MIIDKVLLVEKSTVGGGTLAHVLQSKPWDLTLADTAEKALSHLKQEDYDLMLCDIELSDGSGLDVLKECKRLSPDTIVILIATSSNIDKAIEAVQHGAFNYLLRPFALEALETLITKAQEHVSLLHENQLLRSEVSCQHSLERYQIIAESPLMRQILENVAKIAKSNASVFISGESGTGKEIISNAIHYNSLRAHKPFIRVNCPAIPQTLLESEFFGHEKGAFTGAINKRQGRFELAHQGTLLLDEISEVSMEIQPKLLRAIQEQEFERVGGTKSIKVDVRLISTSNRNMKEAIEQKLFREDLYYRLNVVPLQLPPLRDRREDILPLADYFLEKLCLENRKPKKQLSEGAQKKLLDYPWPGNIRELANVIERTIVMNLQHLIQPEDLSIESSCPVPIVSKASLQLGMTLAEIEKNHILATLDSLHYNKTQTAKMLGISIRTLRNKLKEYQSISHVPSGPLL